MANDGAKNGAELAAGYAWSHRAYEIGAITATTSTLIWLVVRLLACPRLSGWWIPLAALAGILFADFVSGFFHWAFDTWGSVDTPIVGRIAIRTFRHHHVDQKAITTHDFIETNGHNFGLSLTVTTSGLLYVVPERATLFDVFLGMAMVFAVVFVSLTSQIHKWAHEDSPPRLIQIFQRARLLLTAEHHAQHHAAPHTRNYCITVGWLNGPLRAIRFFETLERVISAVTGAVPREDDLGKEAALDVVAEESADEEETAARALVTRD